MNAIWLVVMVISFTGYIIGGIVGKLAIKGLPSYTNYLFIVTGGLLIGLITFRLIPESFQLYPGSVIMVGVVLGIILMFFMERIVVISNNKQHSVLPLSVAIAFHNLPTGIAVGINMTTSSELTTIFLLSLFLHHIPEGLALMIPFNNSKSYKQVFTIGLGLSALIGIGTLVGSWIGYSVQIMQVNALLIGVAIGSLWLIIFQELLFKEKLPSTLKFLTVFLCGVLVPVVLF